MKVTTYIKEKLQYYINNNEDVYQFCDELVEISNEAMQKNKEELLDYFKRANQILVYADDDVLFLLYDVGVLTCISKKATLDNNLIAA